MAKLPYLTGPREPGKWYIYKEGPIRRKDDRTRNTLDSGAKARLVAMYDSEEDALAAKGLLEKEHGYPPGILHVLPPADSEAPDSVDVWVTLYKLMNEAHGKPTYRQMELSKRDVAAADSVFPMIEEIDEKRLAVIVRAEPDSDAGDGSDLCKEALEQAFSCEVSRHSEHH